MKHETKILFICKKRGRFYGPSFGLINSCKFIANALGELGIECKVVCVIDNNDIDREVHKYKPTHVFIEAVWVIPPKFKVLIPRYPKIKWYVRIHSKIPFIANEGIAIEWIRDYYKLSKIYSQLHIVANSEEFVDAFDIAYDIPVLYFPNIYCPPYHRIEEEKYKEKYKHRKSIEIGCFGAIRPMKNQLQQAIAAIAFGNEMGFKVNFHINSDRCEEGGSPVLKNLINAFENTSHKIILHPWMDHHDFIPIVREMDLGMQVSLSETFNIVAADFVWNNIPLVGSDEIGWLDRRYKANPNSIESIIDKLNFAFLGKPHNVQKVNFENLEKHNKKAIKVWLNTL